MEEILNGVSWPGVVIGAIVAFLLCWLWFSPRLFGKGWAEGVGADPDSASEMPLGAMATQAAGLFLMSWFVGVTAVSNQLLTVILGTVAFAVLSYAGGMFSKKNGYARGVEAGYLISALAIMIISQAIF
ncbi:MAG: DUF1761 family protein [Halocynthiibacter sp.]